MTARVREIDAGFTLIEVLIVALILGLLFAAGVPAINSSLSEKKVDSAAGEIVSAIRYVQSISIKENRSCGVDFNTGSEEIKCWCNSADVYHPIDKKKYEIFFREDRRFKGVDIVSANFNGNQKAEFNTAGSALFAGQVALTYGGFTRTVSMTAPVGRVNVQ